MERNYVARQKNDQIKRNYCKSNGYELLEISYKQLRSVDSILSKKLLI